MKISIFITSLLLITASVFAQSTSENENKPENMRFVSQGTLKMKIIENNKPKEATVPISSFWVSQEITNKEFRVFLNYVVENPGKIVIYNEQKRILIGDSVSGKIHDSVFTKKSFLRYSQVLSQLIDSTILEKENIQFANYLTDEKFNDYPVVGISYKAALFYCIWKTEMENNKLKEQGKPTAPEYRLPTLSEWEYIASQPEISRPKDFNEKMLCPVKTGILNVFGLYNITGNVSEWTSSYPKANWTKLTDNKEEPVTTRIVKGGSWKNSSDINKVLELNQDSKTNYIGFRIVRSE